MNFKIMLTILAGLVLFSNLVLAQFMPPHAFYGSVTWNGSPAPDGTKVSAKIDGVEVASTTTKNGKYGYDPIFYVEDPHGDRSGSIISFFVNDIDTGKTAIFVNGDVTHLDLSASGGTTGGGTGGGGGGGFIPSGSTEETEEETPETAEEQPCQERWICTDWSECVDGKQTRTCEDVNKCGTDNDIPLMVQPCSSKEIEKIETPETTESIGPTGFFLGLSTGEWLTGIIIGIVVAIVLIFLLTRKKKRK